MPKTIPLSERDSFENLRQAIRSSKEERQKTRLRAIMCLKEGRDRTSVARQFVVSLDTVTNWVKAYNEKGIVGLSMSRGGRPEGNPKWDKKIFQALQKEIDKGGRYWSIPLMRDWIEENYKENIPENTIWYHVHSDGYSYKSARPHPYHGDVEKQMAFKKGVSSRRSKR